MSLPIPLRPDSATSSNVALAHAVAIAVVDNVLTVRLPDDRIVQAELALPVPYEAEIGDALLVIGDGAQHFVIGVLAGRGKAVLRFQSDVEVKAEGGSLRLAADKGVEIDAPQIALRSRKLDLFATSITQRARTVLQSVSELLTVQAGKLHTSVVGTHHTQAKAANLVTEDKVRINGKAIHLGG
jgi:Protein of unknown function (DUF3540)